VVPLLFDFSSSDVLPSSLFEHSPSDELTLAFLFAFTTTSLDDVSEVSYSLSEVST